MVRRTEGVVSVTRTGMWIYFAFFCFFFLFWFIILLMRFGGEGGGGRVGSME